MTNTSQTSSFVENEEDSDLFSESNSDGSMNKHEKKLELNGLNGKGLMEVERAISVDDKCAIIQDWLFQGTPVVM